MRGCIHTESDMIGWYNSIQLEGMALYRIHANSFQEDTKGKSRWFLRFLETVFRWSWAACPATARPGGRKRTCFPCCCSRAYMRHNCFCLVSSKGFNIMSALSVRQSPTLPQKIDSREGLFWCKKGVVCECGKMNFYLKKLSFAPILGLFAARCSAFWC